jgi:hypothetical protein
MQQWHKGPRLKTTATFEEGNNWQRHQRTRQETGAMSEKPEDIILEDHWAGDIEASCRDFQQV